MTTPSLQARLPDSGISPSLLASWALLHSENGLSLKFLFILACFPLSLALQKSPKDPNDTQLQAVLGQEIWCSSFHTDAQLFLLSGWTARPAT